MRDLRRLLGRRRGVRTHLVMPADTSVGVGAPDLRRFADAQPDRVVLSKLDEAESPSPLFAWLIGTRHSRVVPDRPGSACPKTWSARRRQCWPRRCSATIRALAPAGSLS